MCGIAGILASATSAAPVDTDELIRTRDAMAPRGPDGLGLWLSDDRRVGLAHRRLAILDLSDAGSQPMLDADTGCCITYNGEIYNCREVREALEVKGHRFRSTSDTEVLLRAYIEHGQDMLPLLRGMFAFCIWDPRTQRALLARDPLGIKPLYVAADGMTVRFASQVKALLAGGDVKDLRPDPAARVGFYLWGSVPEPHTLYRGIRMLPAGTSAWVIDGRMEAPRAYFDVTAEIARGEHGRVRPEPPADARQQLRQALARSVSCHRVSDVPVGVFLSAGIDSTAIASLTCEAHSAARVRTLTIAFDEYRGTPHDESALAEQVAGLIRSDHSTVRVAGEQFRAQVDHALAAMDQPTIDGLNTYFVVKAARECGLKVVLSGVGGDELFGGYSYYRRVPRLLRRLRTLARLPGVGRATRSLARSIAQMVGKPKAASILEMSRDTTSAYLLCRGLMLPWELPQVMDHEELRQGLSELGTFDAMRKSIAGITDVRLQLCALDFNWYLRNQLLRDSDWASMAHSVELRTPLVDAWLLRDLMRLHAQGLRPSKQDFASAVNPQIAALLSSRPKTGFSIPVAEWMPERLRVHGGRANPSRVWARHVLAQCGDRP
jgi:asparagine synthase (glutamine-hydrolysing)